MTLLKKRNMRNLRKKLKNFYSRVKCNIDIEMEPKLKGAAFPKIEGLTPVIDPAAKPIRCGMQKWGSNSL